MASMTSLVATVCDRSGSTRPPNLKALAPSAMNCLSVMGCRRTPISEAASSQAVISARPSALPSGTSSSKTPGSACANSDSDGLAHIDLKGESSEADGRLCTALPDSGARLSQALKLKASSNVKVKTAQTKPAERYCFIEHNHEVVKAKIFPRLERAPCRFFNHVFDGHGI